MVPAVSTCGQRPTMNYTIYTVSKCSTDHSVNMLSVLTLNLPNYFYQHLPAVTVTSAGLDFKNGTDDFKSYTSDKLIKKHQTGLFLSRSLEETEDSGNTFGNELSVVKQLSRF